MDDLLQSEYRIQKIFRRQRSNRFVYKTEDGRSENQPERREGRYANVCSRSEPPWLRQMPVQGNAFVFTKRE